MRGSVEDLDWLARQISIFSFDFVIREPDELRLELEKHSREACQVNNNQDDQKLARKLGSFELRYAKMIYIDMGGGPSVSVP